MSCEHVSMIIILIMSSPRKALSLNLNAQLVVIVSSPIRVSISEDHYNIEYCLYNQRHYALVRNAQSVGLISSPGTVPFSEHYQNIEYVISIQVIV